MKFLKITGIILFVLVALFFIVAAFLPKDFHVEQSVVIDRPAEYPFNMVNIFSEWERWSPFSQNDSTLVNSFTGPAGGAGSVMSWNSEKQGSGSMKITESIPLSEIIFELDFGAQGKSSAFFLFYEDNGKTTVSWGMDAKPGYPVERVVYALMKSSMKAVFLKGLNNLKSVCENIPIDKGNTDILSSVPLVKSGKNKTNRPLLYALKLNEVYLAAIKDSCTSKNISEVMARDYGEVMQYVRKNHNDAFGSPVSIWYSYDEETTFGVFEAGVPVGKNSPGSGNITVKKLLSSKVIAGIHYGSYENTMYMYRAIMKYMKDNNLIENEGPIEMYLNDPSNEPDPEKWETVIMFRVK